MKKAGSKRKPEQGAPAKSALPSAPNGVKQKQPEDVDDGISPPGYQGVPVVGLGGSAGGIPALQKFFAATPTDSGLAFVVVLHLDPEHVSILDDILGNATTMPVVQAQDGQKLDPNSVYVIPPGKFLTLTDDRLRLVPIEKERGKRLAVDLFFRTLADTHGTHAAAIILSGADGDGSLGMKRIKERGGLTIVQEPTEAQHMNMPQSAIDTGMVDWVLPVEQMPPRLVEYFGNESRLRLPSEKGPDLPKQKAVPPDSDENALREILTFLRVRTGRDFSCYKRATVLRRVSRRMQVNGTAIMGDYLTYLRTHPGEAGALQQDLLISVTNFFRDREAWEALEKIIPDLFVDKGAGDVVRVWTVACATGEEAFSLGMLLLEQASRMESPPATQIFATDLAEEAIITAREAFYPFTIEADVSEERLRRFFTKEKTGYRVRRELRECVLFAVHDVLKDAPFSRLEMITCRNLLIYLNQDAQRNILSTFHFALQPQGRLFLGSSESVDEDSSLWLLQDKKHRIFRRNSSTKATMRVPVGPDTLARAVAAQEASRSGPYLHGPAFSAKAVQALQRNLPTSGEQISWEELHFKLIERFSPPSIVVTRDYDIVHVSQNAGRLLQFSTGEPSVNLLRVVHPMLRIELRAALFRAAQVNAQVEAFHIPVEMEGRTISVNIRVCPAQEIAPEYLLVVFELLDAVDGNLKPALADEPAVRHLERENEQLKRRLRDVIEQYEASGEELKAGNEELQAMNEELRSSAEELETSREELQSINEELTTVNQELKGKVDELGKANSDFSNLMAATGVAILFLDRGLRITRYTAPAVSLFNLIETDVGRPLNHVTHRLEYPDMKADAEAVLSSLIPRKREVTDGGRWYLAQFLPYRTPEDQILGVVLSFVDITEIKKAAEALAASEQQLRQALAHTEHARAVAEEATRSKDQFLAMVSHELRTPLTPVFLGLGLVEDCGDLPPKVTEAFAMIRRNVEVEKQLIDDLLDVSRITYGKLEVNPVPSDMHQAIREAVEICQLEFEAKKQQLELALEARESFFSFDPSRMRQVFWNLLKNACKFTPEGGKIHVASRSRNGRITVEVHDSGRGFAPEVAERLFDPFSQTNDLQAANLEGLGLGLAIVKAVVERHRGQITASSPGPGQGARFTLELPTK